MKILVTGGAGFIGSHVVDKYIDEGHQVAIVDDLSSGTRANLNPEATFYHMDIRSKGVNHVIGQEMPDVVNHHAAQKSVPKSVERPIQDAEINVVGLLNLLEASVAHGVSRFLFASSGGALASQEKLPARESDEPTLTSPYAITKYTSETYLEYYSSHRGLQFVVLRYANVYGPKQVREGECGVVPIFANNLVRDKPSELYAYSDMPRGTTRDYVFVEDVARANLLALDRGDNEVVNIGTGREVYTADIYEILSKINGKDIPLIKKEERYGDIKRSALDSTKAERVLGWFPLFRLDEGLRQASDYERRSLTLLNSNEK